MCGAYIDNQITNELPNNLITANPLLGLQGPFCDILRAKLSYLPPIAQIRQDGRIMECLEDYKETDLEHRCISRLYRLYPANQITGSGTPNLLML